MNGTAFVDALVHLGYPGAASLDSQSFDWMFEDPTLLPFLDWFCYNVHPKNVLSDHELKEYEELEASGEVILTGRQLEDATAHLNSAQEEQLSEDRLRADVAHLTDDLELSEQKKRMLLAQRNKLSLHLTGLGYRTTQISQLQKEANHAYRNCLEENHANNTKVNNSLLDLNQAVGGLTALYQTAGSGTVGEAGSSTFLSQTSFTDYHRTEEKFTQELTAFTKKKFFEGIADIAGSHQASEYEFLDISNPESSAAVESSKQEQYASMCRELARLQAIYPSSEMQLVNAVVEEKSAAAACAYAEDRLRALKDQCYPQDINRLGKKQKELEGALSLLRKESALLSEEQLPGLIKEAATLQTNYILQGNFNLKVARQDYFTSNQDQVIEQLVLQRARNELLTMCLELEARGHRSTHQLLLALSQHLQRHMRQFRQRMTMLGDPSIAPSRHQRGTIDSRDAATARLHTVLDCESSGQKHLYQTYASLVDAADKLGQQVTTLRASASAASSSRDDRLLTLEQSLGKMENLVYSGSSTAGGQPLLSPAPVIEALTQLDSMMRKLETTVMEVMQDVDHKKKVLKMDRLLAKERELFVYFHTNPHKLRQTVDDITNRLQAALVK